MGKNSKSGAKSAAEQAAAKQAAPENKAKTEKSVESNEKVKVIQLGELEKMIGSRSIGALDANHTADVLTGMRHMFFENKDAAKEFNIPEDSVKELNRITAIGHAVLFTTSVVIDQTPFAIAMRKAELDAILEVAPKIGVTINANLLPAPSEDGTVQLPSNAIEVSEETKNEVKKEAEVAKQKVILNPAEIESEEQLKATLLHILVKGNGSENLYDKISTATNFYESYLSIQAQNKENKEELLAELKKRDRVSLFSDIAHLLGNCTFAIKGVARFMYEETERTKNPVVAYCTLRDACMNEKTGKPSIDDQQIADTVKVIIRWFADCEINESKKVIAGFERDIEILKKDEKKNAKGIEDGLKKIENIKKRIENIEKVANYVYMPSREIADNFASSYMDTKSENFKMCRMIGSKIMKTYYSDVKVKEIKLESLVHNLQQYVGIITNMFLPALQKINDYSEAKLTELEKAEAPAEEEKNS